MSKARIWLTDAGYVALGLPVLGYRILVKRKDRHHLRQRLGFVPAREAARPAMWIHCVSLGEANLVRGFVEQVRRRMPRFEVCISSTTDTGLERAAKLYGATGHVFRFPFDLSPCMRRALDRLRPSVIVLVELETWPNLLALARERAVPVVVINGRLTEKAFGRYRRLRRLVEPMFQALSLVAAQDQTIAERFAALGTPRQRIRIVPSMKFDAAEVADGVEGAAELAAQLGLGPDADLWVAGGTGDDEEPLVLEAHRRMLEGWPSARLAIVPRKPERFEAVAGLVERAGFACVRRSRHGQGTRPPVSSGEVVLGDTMGELRKFYSLAKVAFVGRSLVPMGGSDMMEAAGLGKPVLVGPYTDNFVEPMKILTAAGAVAVAPDAPGLAQKVVELLREPDRGARMGRCGQEAIRANQGASIRTLELICEVLGMPAGPSHMREEPSRTCGGL